MNNSLRELLDRMRAYDSPGCDCQTCIDWRLAIQYLAAMQDEAKGLPHPFHKDASHVHPEYRDGWNHACEQMYAAIAAQSQTKD